MKLVNLSHIFNRPLYINPDYIVVVHHTTKLFASGEYKLEPYTEIVVASGGRGATSPSTTYDIKGDHMADILKAINEQGEIK